MMLNTGRSNLRFFSAKKSADIPWVTSDRLVQNAAQNIFSSPLGKSLNIIKKNDDLPYWSIRVSLPDTARDRLKRNWPCHPLLLVMEVSTVPNIHPLTSSASGIRKGGNFGILS